MKYKDELLAKRYLSDDNPLSVEFNRRTEMGAFVPDESKPFYENLRSKYIFDLRKLALEEIIQIKKHFMTETGEAL